MENHVQGISANDTDAPPDARPLTNNDERAFLHPNPPTLTIRIPPRRLCTVCSRVYPILDKQIPNQLSRCRSCQRRERCSHCHVLKKRKHFRNAIDHDRPFKTWQTCRDKNKNRIRRHRDAAHALGLRWCIYGSHNVTVAACTSADDVLHTSCLPCRERVHAACVPRAPPPAIHHIAQQAAIDDRQAVATERPVDAVPHAPAPVIDHMAEQAAIDDREGVATEPIVPLSFVSTTGTQKKVK